MFLFAIILSFSFSVLSEFIFSKAGIIISVVVTVILIVVNIICDMISVAVASASIEPFAAMRSRKVKGAKQAMRLVKNAEKVSSICNDVIGDICGILMGAAGAVIAMKIISDSAGDIKKVLISAAVSATIAGVSILGKAAFKKLAMDKSTTIILFFGKVLSVFSIKKKKKKKQKGQI